MFKPRLLSTYLFHRFFWRRFIKAAVKRPSLPQAAASLQPAAATAESAQSHAIEMEIVAPQPIAGSHRRHREDPCSGGPHGKHRSCP